LKGKLILIDGYSLANRAFFALPPLTNKQGQHTNAVYGMAMMLLRLVDEEKPDYLAVAFDTGKPTFRHEAYGDYKAGRRPMAEELRSQIPLVRQLFEVFGVPVIAKDGYEADDVLGTMACRGVEAGMDVYIVTGDRDAFQLVGPKVTVLYTKKGITEVERVDLAAVHDRYGLEPRQMIEVKGLMGDPSDNIPGVPGIGEKTALRLIQQFHDIPNLLAHLDQVEKTRERNLLATNQEQAMSSRDLATIRCDLDLALAPEDCRWTGGDRAAVAGFFQEMEFRSLLKRFLVDDSEVGANANIEQVFAVPNYTTVAAGDDLAPILERFGRGPVGLQFFTHRLARSGSRLAGVALGGSEIGYYLVELTGDRLPEPLARWLASKDQVKDYYDGKEFLRIGAWCGEGAAGLREDLRLAGHLLAGSGGDLSLSQMVRSYLGRGELPELRNERGTLVALDALPMDFPFADAGRVAVANVAAITELVPVVREKIGELGMERLYRELELPLTATLFRMEEAGILVDRERLGELGERFRGEMAHLEQEIYELAGEEFNIGSPKQLGVVLFERLGLPAGKKTKSGYSTDAEVLERLAELHPLPDKVLEYRGLAKLNSTYVEALLNLVDSASSKIHTTFQQTVTATGRLSSTDPNLQNIPVRTAEGREIRRVFLPGPGQVLISADYSQIELRVMAHFSQDPKYMAAFLEGDDIHRRTASEIFGVPLAEVDAELRDRAKAVNFGILYGISGFGLARGTGVARKEAERYIKAYFDRYDGVRSFLDGVIEAAREMGYVETMLGRRRYLPDLKSSNFARRSFAERTARNTPIQGTAADIIKLAMLRVEERLKRDALPARILLQVHDELVLEADQAAVREVGLAVKEEMERAVELAVPLVVEVKDGENWGDMKKW